MRRRRSSERRRRAPPRKTRSRSARRRSAISGLVDFLNVNAALAQLLRSENDLVQSEVDVASDLARLYRALGGGWQITE